MTWFNTIMLSVACVFNTMTIISQTRMLKAHNEMIIGIIEGLRRGTIR